MKRAERLSAVLLLPLLLIFSLSASAAGYDTCTGIYNTLKQAGLSPEIQEITPGDQESFPFNITLSFAPAAEHEYAADTRTAVLFVFLQKDFEARSESIIAALKTIAERRSNLYIQALIADQGCIPLGENTNINGITSYTDSVRDTDTLTAVVIRFDDTAKEFVLTPGGSGDTAPSWLVRLLFTACTGQDLPCTITSSGFLSLYKFGLLQNDPVVSPFLAAAIPCTAVSVPAALAGSLPRFIDACLEQYPVKETAEWDRHYSIIQWGSRSWWLPETLFIIAFIIIAVFSLFVICGFSFFVGKNSVLKWQEFIRHGYRLPMMILTSGLALQLGQLITRTAVQHMILSPILQFGFKILFLFIFVSFIMILQFVLHSKTSLFIYGYHQTIISIINIFLFSAVDLSLLTLFTAEYILVYLFRPVKRIVPLICSGLVLFLPFMPHLIILWKYADAAKIQNLVYLPFYQNMLLSCAVQPILIVWLRIFSRIFVSVLQTGRRLTLKSVARLAAVILSIEQAVLLFFICLSWLLMKYRFIQSDARARSAAVIESADRTAPAHLSVSVQDATFLDNATRQINIRSDIPAARYIITVQGNGAVPVYDSPYNFVQPDSRETVQFIIPDYPPRTIHIPFTAGDDADALVSVTALYQQGTEESGRFIQEIRAARKNGKAYEPVE